MIPKYTSKTIIGKPFIVINKETGRIYKGKFILDNGTFEDSKAKITIYFNFEEYIFERIDGAYNNREDIKNKGYYVHTELEWANTNKGAGQEPFLIFTSLDKANYVLKHFIIPPLLKDKLNKADDLMQKYMDLTNDVDRLENQLKQL